MTAPPSVVGKQVERFWRRPSCGVTLSTVTRQSSDTHEGEVRARSDRPGTGSVSDVAKVGAVFGAMWAIAHLVHLANQPNGLSTFTSWTAAAAAVYALGRPGSPDRLALLAVAQIADTAWEWPFMPDHWLLLALVNLVILCTFPFTRGDATRFFDRTWAGARFLLLIGYGAAALAKWNTDFLDPVTSCAVKIADAASVGIVTSWEAANWTHVALAVGAESLVWMCLVLRPTRTLGVLLGLSFHFLVSLSPAIQVTDFTAALFALFILFLPLATVVRATDWVVDRTKRSPTIRVVRRRTTACGILLLLIAGGFGHVSPSLRSAVVWGSFTAYGLLVLGGLASAIRVSADTRRLPLPSAASALALTLMAFNVLNPYVGLRTTTVFAMFSNLRTEGPGNNHLFLPDADFFGYQDDLVIFDGSNDDDLQLLADDGLAAPFFEIQRILGDDPSVVIEGRRAGAMVVYGTDPDMTDPGGTSLWERRLLRFHQVAPAGAEPPCIN